MLPACVQKGVRGWWGTQMEGGDVQPGWRGLPANGRGGGHRPLCLSGMHAKGEGGGGGGRSGPPPRGANKGGGGGVGGGGGAARAERRMEGVGWAPFPLHLCK